MHQHGNRQVRKSGSDRKGEVPISRNRSHAFAGEYVAILARRKLLAQDDFRISPGFGADGEAGIRLKLSEEPSGQHQDRGSTEGTGEGNQVPVFFSHGTQGQVASLGEKGALLAAKAQGAAGYVKLQAAIRRVGQQAIDQRGRAPGLSGMKLRQQRLQMVVIHQAAIVGIGQAEVPHFRSLVEDREDQEP